MEDADVEEPGKVLYLITLMMNLRWSLQKEYFISSRRRLEISPLTTHSLAVHSKSAHDQ